jgi:3-dehydroquinate synthase
MNTHRRGASKEADLPTVICIGVRSSSGAYNVLYGRGLSQGISEQLGRTKAGAGGLPLAENTGVFLLSSPRVWRHVGRKLMSGLDRTAVRRPILFDDREARKNMATVERLCRQLVRAGADRRAVLVAVGGGVVGDVCGYAAASYLRGVRLVHIPTTLVGQVDSAIGGKTGVNLPDGKNLVGAFYPPKLVIADPDTLATLPDREFRSGIYEVIKYGVIGDARLFSYLEQNAERLASRDQAALDFVIPRCIRAKAHIVEQDEREAGLREILNFGHTFAHAFETATAYRRYLHGEAVGWGMIAASRLGVRTAGFSSEEAARIERLVGHVGPLPPPPRVSEKRLLEIMGADKKARGGKFRFVLPLQIGKVKTVADVAPDAVHAVLADLRRPGERIAS